MPVNVNENEKKCNRSSILVILTAMAKEEFIVFHINGTPTKDLLGTAVVKSVQEKYPKKKIIVTTNFPDIWLHNPNIFRVYRIGATPYFYDDYIKERETIVFGHDPYLTTDFIHKNKHIIEIWCDLLKVNYKNNLPELYLTQRESEVAWRLTRTEKPVLFMQPHEMFGPLSNLPSSWVSGPPTSIFQKVASKATEMGYSVVQSVGANQEQIQGVPVINLNLRMTLAALEFTDKRLVINSFAHHAATALGKPSVVTWMTNTPETGGYEVNKNILPKLDDDLKYALEQYSPTFDVRGGVATQNIDTESTFDVNKIIETLEL